jgi:hypothetical protein
MSEPLSTTVSVADSGGETDPPDARVHSGPGTEPPSAWTWRRPVFARTRPVIRSGVATGTVAGSAAARTERRTTPPDKGGSPATRATRASCGAEIERSTELCPRGPCPRGALEEASSAGATAAATRGRIRGGSANDASLDA